MPSLCPSQNFIGLKLRLEQYFFLSITLNVNPTSGWVKMGWVGLGPRIFDLPNVGLSTYFRQPNLPNNPLGRGNPSGQPYRTGTLPIVAGMEPHGECRVSGEGKSAEAWRRSAYIL